jgi:carboxypeptidase family protein/TonB-dependent receptor-like protein
MQLSKVRNFICLVAFLLFSNAPAFTQGGSTGSLAGTIADPSGAVVSGAKVVVKNGETGQEFTATTSDNGTFNVPSLGAAAYTVTVTAQGFKQAIVQNVKVDVGKASSVNIALEVGQTSDTVTVVGVGGELLQTQSATVGQTITGRQIVEQPQASRDGLDLVTLLPGVQTTGRPRTSTINGLPKGALNITLDGVDVQDNLISSSDGFFTFVRPRIDAIEEVTVSTATPGADTSGDGAVQIKFVTRRGTNDYHGSLYWYHRNPALNSNFYFSNLTGQPRSRVLLNQYGGRAGGPISIPKLVSGKDRAFFFVNYEEYRLPEQQLRTPRILSPEAQAGVFRYGTQSVNLLQLAQANGLPSTFDPTVQQLLADIRATTSKGAVLPVPNAPNFQDFSFVSPGGQNRYFAAVRLDFNLSSKHQLENTWNYQEFGGKPVDFLNNTDPAFPGFPNFGGQDSQRWSNSTALRSTLTGRLVNEARFSMLGGISQFLSQVSPAQFANQGGYDLDFGMQNIAAVPAVLRAGLTNATVSPFGNTNNRRNTPNFNFADNLTWLRGAHSLGLGGNYSLIKSFIEANNQFVPNILFGVPDSDPAQAIFDSTNLPGSSAADQALAAQIYAVLTGRVQTVTQNAYLNDGKYALLGPQVTRFSQKLFALYAQDSWRARPNLTLNAGLRWEPQSPVVAQNNNFAKASYESLFGVSGAGNLFKPGTLTGGPTRLTQLGKGERLYDADYDNFAPSVGAAWSPNFKQSLLKRVFGEGGQTVIRGGYSLAYVREGLSNVITPVTNNPGGVLSASLDVDAGNLPAGTLFRNRAALAAPSIPSAPTYPLTADVFDIVLGFDPNLHTGKVHSWSFGIQREITKDTVFEARYVGTRGRDLWRRYGLNETNLIENGFLEEFKLAQGNLRANQAAGRGNTFAYFGPNTSTAPLPIILSFLSGAPAAQAGNAALYTSADFRSAARLATLSPNNANPVALANFLNVNFLGRGMAAGRPANFFVVNPDLILVGVGGGLPGVSLTTNDVNTWYDALQLEARRRLAKGLLLQANYTFSKALSNFFAASDNSNSQPLTLRPQNEELERFRAPQDLRHAFKVNWIYELPFGRGRAFGANVNGFVDRLIGGWEWHGAARVQSGRPMSFGAVQLVGMTVGELQDMIKIRKGADRVITYLPADVILNTRRAFNVDATSATGYSSLGAPTGQYIAPANSNGCLQGFTGQCGFSRLVLEGPSFTRFDMSVVKKVRFTERSNLEFRAEFLNAFNNINFLIGGTAAADVATIGAFNAGDFGRLQNTWAYQDVSTTNDPGGRLIQFVLRINF